MFLRDCQKFVFVMKRSLWLHFKAHLYRRPLVRESYAFLYGGIGILSVKLHTKEINSQHSSFSCGHLYEFALQNLNLLYFLIYFSFYLLFFFDNCLVLNPPISLCNSTGQIISTWYKCVLRLFVINFERMFHIYQIFVLI